MISAVVVAAGKGSRMNSNASKQYLSLVDKPVLVHTLESFEHQVEITEVVLVCSSGDVSLCKELIDTYSLQKVKQIVPGGEERQDSVYAGLKAATGEFVLIHDGVRPFVSDRLIHKLIHEVQHKDAAVLAVPVKDTIKIVNDQWEVVSTPLRKSLWAIQTPQAFRMSIIKEAYRHAAEQGYRGTDDASLVEFMGLPVHIVHGDYENIKITTPEDLWFAEALIRKREKK